MQIVRLTSGLTAHRLTEKEQDAIWAEINTDISPVGKDIPCFTPRDNLEYYIVSDVNTGGDVWETTLKIKGETHVVKADICRQETRIMGLVRAVYARNKKRKSR